MALVAEVWLGGAGRGGRLDRGQPRLGAYQRLGMVVISSPLIYPSFADVDKLREIIRDMRTGN